MTTLIPKYEQAGSTTVNRPINQKLAENISVKDFGAVGDFNSTTGSGTDDRVAIQAAFDYAKTIVGGCKIVFPAGSYYLGTGYTVNVSGITAQLVLGSVTTANSATNIVIEGEGATIYQGAAGQALFIGYSNGVTIQNLKMIGYAGGTLGASREFDTIITIAYSSENVDIRNCYISNSLGYTILITDDPTVSGGGTSYTPLNISIIGNTIKQRYGNGTSSSLGGSKSLWALSSIDVQGLLVDSNTIYGTIDIEPNNVSGQSTYGCYISNNQFMSGYVTPIVPSGVSTYWADESIGKSNSGGTIIAQGINLVGATGLPVNNDNVFSNNSFDFGTINIGGAVYVATVANNAFRAGKINVGTISGGNTNRYYKISNNSTNTVTDATSGFIVFGGSISNSEFHNNLVINQDIPVISWDGVGGADNGGNTYVGNSSLACVTNPAINLGSSGLSTTSLELATKTASGQVLSFSTSLTDGTNTATLSSNNIYYTTNGKSLTFSARLFVTNPNSISGAYITLPTTSNTSSDYNSIINLSPLQNFTAPASTVQIFGFIGSNSNKCYLYALSNTGTLTGLTASNITSNCVLVFSGSYFIK
jgi:hypothetical protein